MSDILDDYEDAMFDRGKLVEHIPLARLRELTEAERALSSAVDVDQFREPTKMMEVKSDGR